MVSDETVRIIRITRAFVTFIAMGCAFFETELLGFKILFGLLATLWGLTTIFGTLSSTEDMDWRS